MQRCQILADVHDRTEQAKGVEQERNQRGHFHCALRYAPGSEPQDHDDRGLNPGEGHHPGNGGALHRANAVIGRGSRLIDDPLRLPVFCPAGLDRPDGTQGAFERAAQSAHRFLRLLLSAGNTWHQQDEDHDDHQHGDHRGAE